MDLANGRCQRSFGCTLSHRKTVTVWKEAEQRAVSGTGIDAAVEDQIQSERIRWRDILKRIMDCIKYLVSQNLALRGHEESLSLD